MLLYPIYFKLRPIFEDLMQTFVYTTMLFFLAVKIENLSKVNSLTGKRLILNIV